MAIIKKILYISFVFLLSFAFAQEDVNRFQQEENSQTEQVSDDSVDKNGPGNPGDPLPIDDYLPVLFILASGIIIYAGKQKKKYL